jgi:hypothetical protein
MPSRYSCAELEAAITPVVLMRARAVHVAFVLGPLLFFVVAAGVATPRAFGGGGVSDDLLTVLSMVDAGLLFAAFGAGMVVLTRLREAGLERAANPQQMVAVVLRMAVARLALVEASALFGIAVVLLAASSGRLETRPALWFNVAPLAALIATALLTLPSRGRFLRQLAG